MSSHQHKPEEKPSNVVVAIAITVVAILILLYVLNRDTASMPAPIDAQPSVAAQAATEGVVKHMT